ncbi:acyltransferase family protein [Demequina sp. NBRC 110051]|uniref:acyltransferase family protein n=1 Tax=Demequina sp. NBRC 110051 TaxID=1570340 RepID=UPI0009FC135F|nr:acyltransferase family protein [Demequina sp. NBRC 110051]
MFQGGTYAEGPLLTGEQTTSVEPLVKRNVRLTWVDSAKGVSIFLVVLVHATSWLRDLGPVSQGLALFNGIFGDLRMPLFMCMAGFFASKWVDSSWRRLFSGKLSLLIWVYLIWQPLFFVAKYAAGIFMDGQDHTSLAAQALRMAVSPLRPNGETWFLWALAIYFVAAKLLSRVPTWWHLVVAGLVSVAWEYFAVQRISPDMASILGIGILSVVHLYFFFAFGLLCRNLIATSVAKVGQMGALIVLVAWLAVTVLATQAGWRVLPAFPFVLDFFGMCAGIGIGLLLAKWRPLNNLGGNTLQVYVAHVPLLIVLALLLTAFGFSWHSNVVGTLAPIVAAIIVTAVALVLHRWAGAGALKYLYDRPQWFEFRGR